MTEQCVAGECGAAEVEGAEVDRRTGSARAAEPRTLVVSETNGEKRGSAGEGTLCDGCRRMARGVRISVSTAGSFTRFFTVSWIAFGGNERAFRGNEKSTEFPGYK